MTTAVRAENVLDCPHCRKRTGHAFIAERGDYNEIYDVLCVGCSVQYEIPRKTWLNARFLEGGIQSRACLTSYPRVEPHSGEIVNSREDEARVAKAYGFYAAEHGVDRRHDDELADKLRQRERDRKEKLRRAGRELREILKAAKERQRLGYKD